MKRIWFYLVLVFFAVVGIGDGFLREVLRDVTMQTLDPLLIILFDIFSALIFMALVLWLAFYLSRNDMSKPLATFLIVVGALLTFSQLIRYSGWINLGLLSDMSYPGFTLITGSFLLIIGIISLFRLGKMMDQ